MSVERKVEAETVNIDLSTDDLVNSLARRIVEPEPVVVKVEPFPNEPRD